jgi:uncharacterized membrane protein
MTLYTGTSWGSITLALDDTTQSQLTPTQLAEATEIKLYLKSEDGVTTAWDAEQIEDTVQIKVEFSLTIVVPAAGLYRVWARLKKSTGEIAYTAPVDLEVKNPGE